MRLRITILLFAILMAACSLERSADEVLIQSFRVCEEVQSGSLKQEVEKKYFFRDDTLKKTIEIVFSDLPTDSIFGAIFHRMSSTKDFGTSFQHYEGKALRSYREIDSTGVILTAAEWVGRIRALRSNYNLFSPFFGTIDSPIPLDSIYFGREHDIELKEDSAVNGRVCSYLTFTFKSQFDSVMNTDTYHDEIGLWIDKEEHLPIQYSITVDIVMAGDTLHQYERYTLTDHQLSKQKNQDLVPQWKDLPSWVVFKSYVPQEAIAPLTIDSLAPSWSIQTLEGEQISSDELKGEVILLDFFYKACPPCIRAFPIMEQIHQEFGEKGLTLIAIDPVDDPIKVGLEEFLNGFGVTYPIGVNASELATDFRLTAYPTSILIDRAGVLVHIQEGFDDSSEEELVKKIEELLETDND